MDFQQLGCRGKGLGRVVFLHLINLPNGATKGNDFFYQHAPTRADPCSATEKTCHEFGQPPLQCPSKTSNESCTECTSAEEKAWPFPRSGHSTAILLYQKISTKKPQSYQSPSSAQGALKGMLKLAQTSADTAQVPSLAVGLQQQI